MFNHSVDTFLSIEDQAGIFAGSFVVSILLVALVAALLFSRISCDHNLKIECPDCSNWLCCLFGRFLLLKLCPCCFKNMRKRIERKIQEEEAILEQEEKDEKAEIELKEFLK